MNFLDPSKHTRRAFLQRSGQLALAGVATPMAINLAALGEAAAFNATDYKALVCVFLYGGNDYANTLVPFDDANYTRYANLRGAGTGAGLVTPKANLAGTELKPATALANGIKYALAPEMAELSALFNSGQAAALLNVGPLVVPLTRTQYNARGLPQPPKLFSHNDQQSVWQSQGAEGSTIGWGGNIGDLALSSNTNSMFTCISVTGNSVFMSGQQALQYQCSTAGAVAVEAIGNDRNRNWIFYEPAMRQAFAQLIQMSHTHAIAEEYNKVMRRAIAAEATVTSAIGGVNLTTAFPAGNSLADQLKIVAKLIGGRATLGVKRQVFMVSLDGFDVHDNMASRQPVLLRKVSQALAAFYQATVEMGVADKVTAFTASDFGRALSINGDGTDHGWGGHQFIVGGAVKGKAFYGTPPPVSVGNGTGPEDQWHVGQGRLLPSTSVDQYAATLAKWFGVQDAELYGILPNLDNFGSKAGRADYPENLGFMA